MKAQSVRTVGKKKPSDEQHLCEGSESCEKGFRFSQSPRDGGDDERERENEMEERSERIHENRDRKTDGKTERLKWFMKVTVLI